MKAPKATESKSSQVEPLNAPAGTTTYTSVGLVQYYSTSYPLDQLTPTDIESIFLKKDQPERIKKYRQHVDMLKRDKLYAPHVLEKLGSQMASVEALLADGSLRAFGKKDPLRFALEALDSFLAIAETDQYVKPVAMGKKHSKEQSERASNSRPTQITEDMCLSDVVDRIATSTSGREASAKELWSLLFGELDVLGASPQEIDHPLDLKKSKIRFTMSNEKRGKLTFGSFEEMVTKAKKSD